MNLNPKKILVIQHKQIGDVILTTPIVKVLKKHFPDAHLSFLVEKFCTPILEGNPYIDEIISFDKTKMPSLISQLKFYWSIRKMGYDLVLDFFQNPRSTLISLLSAAETTVSYTHQSRGKFYKISVEPTGGYAVDYKLSMLKGIGIESDDNYPEIFVPESAEEYIAKFFSTIGIKDDDFIVCIDPTHRRPTRKWTAYGYAELIDKLCERYNARVVLLWGPGEYKTVYEIKERCKYHCDIACKTDLKQLAALIKRAHILIGNDSAPRHIAVSQNVPTLVVLGSTSEGWTHPAPIHKVIYKHLDCQPCNKNSCNIDIACMKDLKADEVFEKLQSFTSISEALKHFMTRELTAHAKPVSFEEKHEKMKVALLHKKYYFYGGTERYITNLASGLLDAGHEVTIYANRWGKSIDERINFKKIVILKGFKLFKMVSFAVIAQIVLRRESFDVVHGFGKTIEQDVFRTGGGCHKAWQKESLLSIRNGFLRNLKRVKRMLSINQWSTLMIESQTFRKGHYKKIISPSKKVKSQIMKYYNVADEDIEVVYNGVDIEKFNTLNKEKSRAAKRGKYNIGDDEILLVFAATNFRLKGLEFLIKALGYLKERNVRLLIIGGGKRDKFIHLAGSLGVEDKIVFTGIVENINEYYQTGDIFIYPTFYDPFANTCLEAIACGLPVITSKINGMTEILTDGKTGLLLDDPADDKEIADKIRMLLDDEELRQSIIKSGLEIAKQYTTENNTKRTMEIYQQIRRF